MLFKICGKQNEAKNLQTLIWHSQTIILTRVVLRQLLSGNKMNTVISKCYCGSVELELILPNGLENLQRCNCSIFSRRNAVVVSVTIDNLKVVRGSAKLKKYTFNTHRAQYYFCAICGI
jgi:hypothetical protein